MPATPATLPEVAFKSGARLFGALDAAASLACAVLLAVALTYLSQGRVSSGIWLLLGTLGLRWVMTMALDSWSDHARATIRRRWRHALPSHFTRPRSERERSRGDLTLAVDHAADAPALGALEASAVVSLGGLAILAWAGGWVALTITVALLGSAVPLYRRAGQRSEAMAKEYHARRDLLERRQLELLHHTTELRALGAVEYGANEIAAISDSEHAIAMRAIRVALESSLITEFLSGVSIGLVAMVVGFSLLSGRIILEHAFIAVLVTAEIFMNVRRYGVEFHRRDDSARSQLLLDVDTPTPATSTTADVLVASGLVTEASDVPVSFTLRRGDRLVVSGPSGAGKTTLLQTLLAWRGARAGTLVRTSDGTGHVSVESALLSGSLRDNLTLGVDVDDRRITECLASLGLTGPRFDVLDTMLLADGRGISSGERVRLVLARCLLASPALLVLDDIAGVLDDDARRLVRAALEQRPEIGVVEASVDTPLLTSAALRVELAT